jgi:hypothetical protein
VTEYVKITIIIENSLGKRVMTFPKAKCPTLDTDYDPKEFKMSKIDFNFGVYSDNAGRYFTHVESEK